MPARCKPASYDRAAVTRSASSSRRRLSPALQASPPTPDRRTWHDRRDRTKQTNGPHALRRPYVGIPPDLHASGSALLSATSASRNGPPGPRPLRGVAFCFHAGRSGGLARAIALSRLRACPGVVQLHGPGVVGVAADRWRPGCGESRVSDGDGRESRSSPRPPCGRLAKRSRAWQPGGRLFGCVFEPGCEQGLIGARHRRSAAEQAPLYASVTGFETDTTRPKD